VKSIPGLRSMAMICDENGRRGGRERPREREENQEIEEGEERGT